MRLKLITSAIMLASTLAVVVAPAAADAKTRHRVTVCRTVREAANGGLVAGAIGGAQLGSAVAGHGAKTEGAVLGAGIGGLTGRQLAKKSAKRSCHYEYRYY